MAWTTPTLVEICIGLEINGYLPAEFYSSGALALFSLMPARAAGGWLCPTRRMITLYRPNPPAARAFALFERADLP